MNIDFSIVTGYLRDGDDYARHWLFYNISDDGTYTFERPDPSQKENVNNALSKIQHALTDFTPYNAKLFSALFPDWKTIADSADIILSVGVPAPYDAMFREHDGKNYMIFDLIRFLEYEKKGKDITSLIRGMLTHELTHSCIHTDYPDQAVSYREKLTYITFDEGFAHILSFAEDITSYDFSTVIPEHYENALHCLKDAFAETDPQKQEELLLLSNCGAYWDKFAAISGKLYLAEHMDEIAEIYKHGPAAMCTNLLS